MKVAYPTKKLGDLCHIARGGSPRPIQDYLTDAPDGINWVKISDATASDKYIEYTKEKIRPEGLKRSRLVQPGDFILSNSMSFGRPYIMKTTGCIHDGWLVLSDKCGLFDPDFLYHFLGSDAAYRQFDGLAAGSTVRNLNSDLVKTVDVPIPPLDEQRRIVAVLDKAFAGIAAATANAQKNLTNARALFESYLRSVFDAPNPHWQQSTLGKLTSKIGSGATPRGGKDAYKAEGTPLIRSMNVHDRYFKVRNLAFIDDNQAKLLNNVIVQENDVLLNITGASVARCCLAPQDMVGARVNQHVAIIRTNADRIRPEFLELALTSPHYKDILLGVGEKGGSTRQAITKAEIQRMEVAFPALIEQDSFVDHATELQVETRKLAIIANQKLTALTELKQSLLQKAFAGELT